MIALTKEILNMGPRRVYVLNCLQGTAANYVQITVTALGVIDAWAKAHELGVWPVSVASSRWEFEPESSAR